MLEANIYKDNQEPPKNVIWHKISDAGQDLGYYKNTNNKWNKIDINEGELIRHIRYDWVSGASYGKEDIVFHNGSSYIALLDNPSTEPSFTYDPATGSYNVSAGWGLLAVGAAIVQETGDSQDKVMSQKAVTDTLIASDQKLSELEVEIYDTEYTEPYKIQPKSQLLNKRVKIADDGIGGYIIDGTESSTYGARLYEVNGGCSINFQITSTFSTQGYWYVSAWKNGVFIKGLKASGEDVVTGSRIEVNVPKEADSIIVLGNVNVYETDSTKISKIDNIQQSVSSLNIEVANKADVIVGDFENLEPTTILKGKRVHLDGTIVEGTDNDNYNPRVYLVKKGDKIKLTGFVINDGDLGKSISVCSLWSNDTMLSSIKNRVQKDETFEVIIPEGVNKLICASCDAQIKSVITLEFLYNAIKDISPSALNYLKGKTLVIMGDSSCDANYTSWAKDIVTLSEKYGFFVINKGTTSTGWSNIAKTGYDETRPVKVQWEDAKVELNNKKVDEPIIIITSGGNEITKLLVNYNDAITLCESDTSAKSNEKEWAVQTMKDIIDEMPKARIFLVANFNAGGSTNEKNRNRRIYREFLDAMCDFFTCELIDLSRASGIRGYKENEVGGSGYHLFTKDGIHAYTDLGRKRVLETILSNLLSNTMISL